MKNIENNAINIANSNDNNNPHISTYQKINSLNFHLTGNISGYFMYRHHVYPAIAANSKYYILPYKELSSILKITPLSFDSLIALPLSFNYLSLYRQTSRRLIKSLQCPLPSTIPTNYEQLYSYLYKPSIPHILNLNSKIFAKLFPSFSSLSLSLSVKLK